VVSSRCWFRFGNPALPEIRDDHFARGAPRQTHWRSLGAPRSAPPAPRPGTPTLEIVEDRHGRASTLLTSELPVSRWHDVVGEPTLADAILDRIRRHAQRIELKGASLRKRQRAPHGVRPVAPRPPPARAAP
jgi:hypothetical protein